jgi:hypothetical protein
MIALIAHPKPAHTVWLYETQHSDQFCRDRRAWRLTFFFCLSVLGAITLK